jgi:hypothetical protein
MKDPFALDAARRQQLENELIGIRIALAEAHEHRDGAAALAALDALFAFRERFPDVRLAYMPGEELSVGYALPRTSVQMVARYGGYCIECDDPIRRGDVMYWDREDRSMTCARCSVRELVGAQK